MRGLSSIADLVEALEEAPSFDEAASRMVAWGQAVSGCSTGFLRLTHEEDGLGWVPAAAHSGGNPHLLRDEAMVDTRECICGRVAVGAVDTSLPFYTEGGAFVWGRLSRLRTEPHAFALADIRGRCLREGFESLGVFPLGGPGGPVGSLHLADHRPDRFDGVVELLETGCRLAGRLLLRYESQERERVAFELVQRALLPDHPTDIRGLDVRVCFDSATELAHIGGDFYDVVELPGGRVLLLVGDYSGRGVSAVGMATRARYVMTGLAREHDDPAGLFTAADRALAGLLPPERFLTAVACLVDPAAGTATVCLAGHPPPGILRVAGAEEVPAPSNPPLGIASGARFTEITIDVAPHDVLLLFTDGVTESRRHGHLFGFEGIARTWALFDREEATDRPEAASAGPGSAGAGRAGAGSEGAGSEGAGCAGAGCAGDPTDALERLACAVCEASVAHHDPDLPGDDRLALAARIWPPERRGTTAE